MNYDRKVFFDGFRDFLKKRNESLTQSRVDALEFLLGEFEKEPLWEDVRHVAYALATISVETAYTYLPIQEYGSRNYFERRYGHTTRKGRELGNTEPGDGTKYSGKGYVQLTGRANYVKANQKLKTQASELVSAFEEKTGVTFDMVSDAEQAKDPIIAFAVMTLGMHQGWFTGMNLDRYINSTKKDYRNARRIINGLDKANMIAQMALDFEVILKEACKAYDGQLFVEPVIEVTEDEEEPVKDPIVATMADDETKVAVVDGPKKYNKIGFWATIQKDLRNVIGGNFSIGMLTQAYEWITGLSIPEKILYLIIGLAILGTIIYIAARGLHYLVDTWKQNQKVKLIAEINASPEKKDIVWSGDE